MDKSKETKSSNRKMGNKFNQRCYKCFGTKVFDHQSLVRCSICPLWFHENCLKNDEENFYGHVDKDYISRYLQLPQAKFDYIKSIQNELDLCYACKEIISSWIALFAESFDDFGFYYHTYPSREVILYTMNDVISRLQERKQQSNNQQTSKVIENIIEKVFTRRANKTETAYVDINDFYAKNWKKPFAIGRRLKSYFERQNFDHIRRLIESQRKRILDQKLNLSMIFRRLKNDHYVTLEQLLHDVKTLSYQLSDETSSSDELIENVHSNIVRNLQLIRQCPDCYFYLKTTNNSEQQNPHLLQCTYPHGLVWARRLIQVTKNYTKKDDDDDDRKDRRVYRWWPAKVYKSPGNSKPCTIVKIRFFGPRKLQTFSLNFRDESFCSDDCYLIAPISQLWTYSAQIPKESSSNNHEQLVALLEEKNLSLDQDFLFAQREVSLYIEQHNRWWSGYCSEQLPTTPERFDISKHLFLPHDFEPQNLKDCDDGLLNDETKRKSFLAEKFNKKSPTLIESEKIPSLDDELKEENDEEKEAVLVTSSVPNMMTADDETIPLWSSISSSDSGVDVASPQSFSSRKTKRSHQTSSSSSPSVSSSISIDEIFSPDEVFFNADSKSVQNKNLEQLNFNEQSLSLDEEEKQIFEPNKSKRLCTMHVKNQDQVSSAASLEMISCSNLNDDTECHIPSLDFFQMFPETSSLQSTFVPEESHSTDVWHYASSSSTSYSFSHRFSPGLASSDDSPTTTINTAFSTEGANLVNHHGMADDFYQMSPDSLASNSSSPTSTTSKTFNHHPWLPSSSISNSFSCRKSDFSQSQHKFYGHVSSKQQNHHYQEPLNNNTVYSVFVNTPPQSDNDFGVLATHQPNFIQANCSSISSYYGPADSSSSSSGSKSQQPCSLSDAFVNSEYVRESFQT